MTSRDTLINRRNWQDTREYMAHCREVLLNQERTVMFINVAMDHLLRWATSTPFSRVQEIRPVFQQYLTNDIGGTPAYLNKLLSVVRTYFRWAKDRWPERYVKAKEEWIARLRSKKKPGRVKEKEVFSLDLVRSLVDFEPANRVERRERAMAAFLFLSGMRAGAFVSLPVRSVVLDYQVPQSGETVILVRQWPDWGVRTKNCKAANTYLLPQSELADLREIVREWHQEVLDGVGETGMWWAILQPDGEQFAPVQIPGANRRNGLEKRLHWLCDLRGRPYLSPHKLRHGHIGWAQEQCKNESERKAVSQNVMHESVHFTDSEYGGLTDDNLAWQLCNIGLNMQRLLEDERVMKILAKALAKYRPDIASAAD